MDGISFFMFLFFFFTFIYWMVVGWRTMKAHEKVADSLEWMARESAKSNNRNVKTRTDTFEKTE